MDGEVETAPRDREEILARRRRENKELRGS